MVHAPVTKNPHPAGPEKTGQAKRLLQQPLRIRVGEIRSESVALLLGPSGKLRQVVFENGRADLQDLQMVLLHQRAGAVKLRPGKIHHILVPQPAQFAPAQAVTGNKTDGDLKVLRDFVGNDTEFPAESGKLPGARRVRGLGRIDCRTPTVALRPRAFHCKLLLCAAPHPSRPRSGR